MGKGEIMSKRKRSKKKTLHFTDADKVLIGLEKVAKAGQKDAEAANSLKLWWLEHKEWSQKQWLYAKAIVARHGKPRAKTKQAKYHLYAITDGRSVKLGYSSDIKKRIKQMQTGHPEVLKCVWKYYTGTNEVQAKNLEKKLHRFCKKYRVRGEWFAKNCLTLVDQFSIKEKITRDFNIERQEVEIMLEAEQHI